LKKCIAVVLKKCTQILSGKTVFNIDNNDKCYLSTKSAYSKDFWRIMWH